MKFLIFLTFFSSTFASKICTKEYFIGASNFNPELENSKWKIKKSLVKFSERPYGVERILFHMQTAFNCDYNSVEITKVSIMIKTDLDDPMACPPISFRWKSEEIIKANFLENIAQPFSYVYEFVHQKFFIIVGCNWNEADGSEIVSAFVFVERNSDLMSSEVDDVS
jgi:hypothetical protein